MKTSAIVLVVALSCVVFARNLFVDNAVIFHDEYVYKVSADRQVEQAQVIDRELAPVLPNRLFLKLYGVGSYFGTNYYPFAQFLNVVFWALGLLALHRLAVLTGLSGASALVFLGAAALLPLNAYTKYFLPESLYFALFCAQAYALLRGVLWRSDLAVVAAGLATGLLYFVKPHALALVVANVLFLAMLPGRVRLNLLFFAGLVVPILGMKALGRMPAGKTGLGLGTYEPVVEAFFRSLFGTGIETLGAFARVALGHALYPLCAFGLSLLVVVTVLVPPGRLRERAVPVPEPIRLLSAYLLAASVVLVTMALSFNGLWGALRVHSRYYFFLFPLALLLLFHVPALRLTRAGKGLGLALALGGPLLMAAWGPGFSPVLPYSLVSDSPEWGFVFLSRPLFFAAVAAFGAAGAWAVLRRKVTLLVAVVCLTSAASLVDVAMKQKGVFRGPFTTGREAMVVEGLLGRSQMADAIVVGENRDVLTKFLFGLTTTPRIERREAGSNLDQLAAQFPQATHVVTLSDTYVLTPPLFQCTAIPPVRVCTLHRAPPAE